MRRSEPGLATLLVKDLAGIAELSSMERQTLSLLLDDAALLHRDPRAERSRLQTRSFVTAVAARWWDGRDPELLCAQMILYRFASAIDATLSAADGWIEMAAGGAVIEEADGVRLAVLHVPSTDHDGEITHAATFGSHECVSYSVVASSPMHRESALRVRLLAKAQITALARR